MIWNRDGIIWYSEDEIESYKQSEQEGLEIVAELKAENEKLKTEVFRFEGKQTSMCEQNKELIEDNLNISKENEQLKALCDTYRTCYQAKHGDIKGMLFKYRTTLQEIKGLVTALYMNNWLQKNETARKSIQLLQELITKAEDNQ